MPTSGCGSPRAASATDPPTRSRSISGSPARCSSKPIVAPTAPLPASCIAHGLRRRPPDESEAFAEYLARLREQYRRRPTLIEILDKAELR